MGQRRVIGVAAAALVLAAGCSLGGGEPSGGTDAAEPEVAGATTIAEGAADGADQDTTTSTILDEDAVELAGSSWALTVIDIGKGRKDASVPAIPAVVNFGDGTIDAYDGANTVSGSFEVDGSEVTITLEEDSGLAYPTPLKAQYDLFSAMPKTVSAQRDDERLVLELRGGGELVFEPAAGGISQN